MKKLFIAVFAIAMFASCKKETVNPPVVAPEPTLEKKVKTKTISSPLYSTTAYTYSYETRGRLSSIRQVDPGKERVTTFNYATPGKIFITSKDNGVPRPSQECDVNDKGLITVMKVILPDGSLYETHTFTYDANGQVARKDIVNSNGTVSYYENKIENGNVTESKLFWNGVLDYTATFTYDLTKSNTTCFTWNAYWDQCASFGKGNKNLLLTYKATRADGVVTFNTIYTYQLNAAGYAEKVGVNNPVTGYTGEDVYTFE